MNSTKTRRSVAKSFMIYPKNVVALYSRCKTSRTNFFHSCEKFPRFLFNLTKLKNPFHTGTKIARRQFREIYNVAPRPSVRHFLVIKTICNDDPFVVSCATAKENNLQCKLRLIIKKVNNNFKNKMQQKTWKFYLVHALKVVDPACCFFARKIILLTAWVCTNDRLCFGINVKCNVKESCYSWWCSCSIRLEMRQNNLTSCIYRQDFMERWNWVTVFLRLLGKSVSWEKNL